MPVAVRLDPLLRKARLYSGLAIFAYVLPHFCAHALGLISLEAQDAAGRVMVNVWRFPPMAVLLYGSLAAHAISATAHLLLRKNYNLTASEWGQVISGYAIPLLLLTHVTATRWANVAYDLNDHYAYLLFSTIILSPFYGWLNAAGLVVAWTHGVIGLHRWFSFMRFYTPAWRNAGLVLATLIPVLSLAGYLAAGRALAPLTESGEWLEAYFERLNWSTDEVWGWIATDIRNATWSTAIFFVLLAAGRLAWHFARRRLGQTQIDYVDGPTVTHRKGATLLETSKLAGVPHASVCGGRGRCSTCRVRVVESAADLPAVEEGERKLLDRLKAPEDVRLACQLRPQGNLKVIRLLPSDATVASAVQVQNWSSGQEKVVSVMFADLRDFTKVSETRLPYDVVYLINQFSRSMGEAVEASGGRIDKFLGDGFMALFGVDTGPEEAARQALDAAGEMQRKLEALNAQLKGDLPQPMRMGIGLHSGSVVLGEMGYGSSRGLTAIGDAVNTASRLEAATKEFGCKICVSKATADLAGRAFPEEAKRSASLRGKAQVLEIYALDGVGEVAISG
jgi:adenylate cyclase